MFVDRFMTCGCVGGSDFSGEYLMFKMCVFENDGAVNVVHCFRDCDDHREIYRCGPRIATIQDSPLITAPDSPSGWKSPYRLLAVSIKLSARLSIRVRLLSVWAGLGWAGRPLAAKTL